MNAELWQRVYVSASAMILPFLCLIGRDIYLNWKYGHTGTYSHAWAVLGNEYQVVPPLFAFLAFGFAAGFTIHFFTGIVTEAMRRMHS